jgi:hypothetical protein
MKIYIVKEVSDITWEMDGDGPYDNHCHQKTNNLKSFISKESAENYKKQKELHKSVQEEMIAFENEDFYNIQIDKTYYIDEIELI